MASGESFDEMLARVQAKRSAASSSGSLARTEGSTPMAFPKKNLKSSKGGSDAGTPPAFIKQKGKGKPFGKSAPAQKAMRFGGRSMRGGR